MGLIELVDAADRDRVLARVLAPCGGPPRAPQAHVDSFAKYMCACGLEWKAWRVRRRRRDTALLFMLFLPGKTAIAMFPAPLAPDIVPDDQQRLMSASLESLADRSLRYVQALVEQQAEGKRSLLGKVGFKYLTQLIYLERGSPFPRFERRAANEPTWVSYDEQNHHAFAQILQATYENSRDCPELTGLRSIDEVIASHKAAGEFDPALWEMACVNSEPVGCILLSRLVHGPLLEIVYVGVASRWRKCGFGKLLIRRALAQCRALSVRQLTAVVDARNRPARQLYAQFGFKPTAVREAYLYCS